MRLVTCASAEMMAAVAADVVAQVVAANPAAVVAWPTGKTAVPLYAELARRHGARLLDLSSVRGFNLDELLLEPEHPASFRRYMEHHAWGRTGLDPARNQLPNSAAADLTAECRRYDAEIAAADGIDLALLGVGADGHVAYNLPGPPVAGTHVVVVPDEVAERLQVPAARRPLRAITMGIATILAARRVVLMASEASKARAVRALLDGPADPQWPCSLLRDHQNLEVLATAVATQGAAWNPLVQPR